MANTEENMEERILQAAEEMFMKQGFAKTTTAQIAKEAGCNQALVHYYYRTKDNLFNKIFESKIGLVVSNLVSLNDSESNMSFEEKICKIVEIHFSFLTNNSRLVPFIVIEFASNPGRFKEIVESNLNRFRHMFFNKIEEEMEREIKSGHIADITLAQLIQDIVSLNVAAFLTHDTFQQAFGLSDEAMSSHMEERKQEITKVIKARLRP